MTSWGAAAPGGRNPDEAPAVPAARIPYVDVARGFCVVAVVLTHVGTYHYEPVVTTEGSPWAVTWAEINDALRLARMPLLLMLSGWLAANKIKQGFGFIRTSRAQHD